MALLGQERVKGDKTQDIHQGTSKGWIVVDQTGKLDADTQVDNNISEKRYMMVGPEPYAGYEYPKSF